MQPDPNMPPLPRDHAVPSFSELVPIRSSKISLRKSGILIPGLVTVAFCLYLFSIAGSLQVADVKKFAVAIGSYLLFVLFWIIHTYSGTRKPLWIFAVPAVITMVLLQSPFIDALSWSSAGFCRRRLPKPRLSGSSSRCSSARADGRSDEGLPVLLGVWVASRVDQKGNRGAEPLLDCSPCGPRSPASLFGVPRGSGSSRSRRSCNTTPTRSRGW
jgi:hypothetical protein